LQSGSQADELGRIADEEKIGTPWRDDELDAIINDYFSMLDAELLGRPYVKARHSAALMERIGRTHRSVEFKHQNISAVLDELGLQWIPGYKPKRNYQGAIFDAIDRYLTAHSEFLTQPLRSPPLRRTASNLSLIPLPWPSRSHGPSGSSSSCANSIQWSGIIAIGRSAGLASPSYSKWSDDSSQTCIGRTSLVGSGGLRMKMVMVPDTISCHLICLAASA
jgi:hypothetical protein